VGWVQSASEWIKAAFENVGLGPMALPLALLLGLLSAVAAACCTLPVLGAIVGYSGTRKTSNSRTNLLGAFFFMLGTIIALLILGSVAGFVAIIMGLATLKLLPFKLPQERAEIRSQPRGFWGAALFGLVMGGAVSVCSLACNPGIFIILGVAVLQGYTLWMFGVLVAYSIGFSLPLTALMLGASFGRSAITAQKAEVGIRTAAGVLLIAVGFYFLSTF